MARFDVHWMRDGETLVVDCQSDSVDWFDTRFVVPLVLPGETNAPLPRLMPTFMIDGERRILATHLATAVRRAALGPRIASLAEHEMAISAALDLLISGY